MKASHGNVEAQPAPEAVVCILLVRFVTLSPGDVFLTGTPPGVGVFRKPPVFLKVIENTKAHQNF